VATDGITEEELERLVDSVAAGPEHERIYADLIGRSGVAISATESWALWHLGALGPITAHRLAAELHVARELMGNMITALGRLGYVRPDTQDRLDLTRSGRHALVQLIEAGQAEIALLLRGREPRNERDRARVLGRLTKTVLMTMPTTVEPGS